MRESALFQHYRTHAAGVGAYHGWATPVSFGAFEQEYLAASKGVACFDSSFRGRLRLRGRDALDLLHRLSTNDLRTLGAGEAAGTALTTEKGRVVDFLTLFQDQGSLLLITSPAKATEVKRWIEKFVILEDVAIEDITAHTVMVSLIGPEADSAISVLISGESPRASQIQMNWGELCVIHSRWPHTSELQLVVDAERAGDFWAWLQGRIIQTGVFRTSGDARIPFIGSQAYEAYRIAFGIPMTVNELIESRNPYEVGLRPFISYTKGCYIGQEVIARLDTYRKVRRRLVGLVFGRGEGPVDHGGTLTAGGEEVGHLTSVTEAPVLGARLGLGVVREDIPCGAEVHCPAVGGVAGATVCDFPMRWP